MELNQPFVPNMTDQSPFLNKQNTKLKKGLTQSKLTSYNQGVEIMNIGQSGSFKEFRKERDKLCDVSSLDSVNSNSSGEHMPSTETKPICPVCYHDVMKKDLSNHMKTCAAKHNISLAQMLDAVELLKNYSDQRRALGLPDILTSPVKRKPVIRKTSRSYSNSDPELHLGLALSESLRDANDKCIMEQDEILMEAGLGHEVVERQATLLEKYRFHRSRPVLQSSKGSRLRAGKSANSLPSLLTRSDDDRNRLVAEKVSRILSTSEDYQSSSVPCQSNKSPSVIIKQKSFLHQQKENENELWLKASSSPHSDDDNNAYYVSTLSNFVITSKIMCREKRRSESPCEKLLTETLQTQSKYAELDVKSSGSELSPKIEYSSANKNCKSSIIEPSELSSEHGKYEIMQRLMDDWKSLLNNPKWSDVVIKGNGYEIQCHELIFRVRCPTIVEEIVNGKDEKKYIFWNELKYESVNAFLCYIYCGDVSFLSLLPNVNQNEVLLLAKKYEIKDLENYLLYIKQSGIVDKETLKLENVLTEKLFNSNPQELISLNEEKVFVNSGVYSQNTSSKEEESVDNMCKLDEFGCESSLKGPSSPDPFVDWEEVENCDNASSNLGCVGNCTSPYASPSKDEDIDLHISYSKIVISPENCCKESPKILNVPDSHSFQEIMNKCRKKLFEVQKNDVENEDVEKEQNLNVNSDNDYQKNITNHSPENIQQALKCEMVEDDSSIHSREPSVTAVSSPTSSIICLSECNENLSPKSPKMVGNDILESVPPCNKSCSSVKKLLEDSFFDALGRSFVIKTPTSDAAVTPENLNITPSNHTSTCSGDNVTPMPNYDSMDTPNLQKELRKFGIRKLKRRQAKLLLKHIYEELHPVCETKDHNDIVEPIVENKVQPLMDDPPNIENELQPLMDDPPIIENEVQLLDDPPSIESEVQLLDDPPIIENEDQLLMDDAPIIENEDQLLMDDPPIIENEDQLLMDDAPIIENEDQLLMDDAPIIENEVQPLMDDAPNAECSDPEKSEEEEEEEEDDDYCSLQPRDLDFGRCITASQRRIMESMIEYEVGDCSNENLTEQELDLPEKLFSLITSDSQLYQRVLLYDPVKIEEIQCALKSLNTKSKVGHVMEFLDTEGITFQMKETTAKRQL